MKTKVGIIIALLVVIVLGGCNFFQKKEKSSNKKEVIKIGAILPLTGLGSEYGVDQKNGIQFAQAKINLSNKKLQVSFFDSKGESKTAVNIVNQLNSKTKVFLSTLSNVSMSIKPFIINTNSLLITIATNPELTKDNNNVIRMLPTSNDYINEINNYIENNINNNVKIFILYSNNDFGNSLFVKADNELKTKYIINSYSFNSANTDFRNILSKIKQKIHKVDIILVFGYSKALGFFIKQARVYNLNNLIISTPEISYPETKKIANDAYKNIAYVTLQVDTSKSVTKTFLKEYNKKFGKNPSLDAFLGYDELMLFNEAYKVNPNNYFASIYKITYDGFFGKLKVDKSGNVIFPLKMIYIK